MARDEAGYLMDTSCWMEWQKGSDVGVRVERFLRGKRVFTPSSALGELRKNMGDRYYKIKALILRESETISCDDEISEYAGYLKKTKVVTGMSWVDYVIVSAAKNRGLTVCSTDHHFTHFRDIVGVRLFEKRGRGRGR